MLLSRAYKYPELFPSINSKSPVCFIWLPKLCGVEIFQLSQQIPLTINLFDSTSSKTYFEWNRVLYPGSVYLESRYLDSFWGRYKNTLAVIFTNGKEVAVSIINLDEDFMMGLHCASFESCNYMPEIKTNDEELSSSDSKCANSNLEIELTAAKLLF
jgi:hypothetical protein